MKRFLLALTLVACMGAVTACGGGAAQKKSVGIQLYSLHQDMGNVEASLQRLADIGYTSVETLNGNGDPNCFGMSPADFKALCDKVGLTITSTHASIQNDPANEEAVMERWRVLFDALRTMGAKYCIMPGYAFGSTLEEIAASCDYCNRVGKLATEYGLKLGYHNHAHEFEGGKDRMKKLLDDLPFLRAEPDVFWLHVAGFNAQKYLRKLGERAELVHIKEAAAEDPARSAEPFVGEGAVGMEGVFSAMREIGAKWAILEAEQFACSAEEYLRRSFINMQKLAEQVR